MPRQNLGRVAMVHKGAYNSATTYNNLDIVEYNGSSYVCKVDNTINIVPTDTSKWNLLVQKPVKGTDYYTEQDKQEIISDIEQTAGFITKDVSNLTYYTKTSDMNTAISNAVDGEKTLRQNADNNLQSQIDAIVSATDVVDVVGTYTELQNYDASKLTDKDVIKVLQDSTHNNALSYYRWVITSNVGAWNYVGSEGPFYTKSETDTLLNAKQDTIDSSHKLSVDLVDGAEKSSNKVTTIDSSSTDEQYPSAKSVYDLVGDINTALDQLNGEVV